MDFHKILNFKTDNPNLEFPDYKILSDLVKKNLIKSLFYNLKISNDLNGANLSKSIEKKSIIIGKISDGVFILDDLLSNFGYSANEKIYLNWKNFESIEEMSKLSFNQNFFDIWYPGVDDLDIFDESCNWLLSITHAGIVKALVNTEGQ